MRMYIKYKLEFQIDATNYWQFHLLRGAEFSSLMHTTSVISIFRSGIRHFARFCKIVRYSSLRRFQNISCM